MTFHHLLRIPKTSLNPQFNVIQRKTEFNPLVDIQLYNWQLKKPISDKWIIHDLPIPVYGKLHLGHFYNKIIKDIINRYKLLKGFKINYSIGIFVYAYMST